MRQATQEKVLVSVDKEGAHPSVLSISNVQRQRQAPPGGEEEAFTCMAFLDLHRIRKKPGALRPPFRAAGRLPSRRAGLSS